MFWNYIQCNLKACKKHSIKSIHIKTPNVTPENKGYNEIRNIEPNIQLSEPRPNPNVFSRKTSDNCECAKLNAQSLK